MIKTVIFATYKILNPDRENMVDISLGEVLSVKLQFCILDYLYVLCICKSEVAVEKLVKIEKMRVQSQITGFAL